MQLQLGLQHALQVLHIVVLEFDDFGTRQVGAILDGEVDHLQAVGPASSSGRTEYKVEHCVANLIYRRGVGSIGAASEAHDRNLEAI